MTRPAFTVLLILVLSAAVACDQISPVFPTVTTSPAAASGNDQHPLTSALMGTWSATRVAAWREVPNGHGGWAEVPGSRRDLVADGGTITLRLEPNSQRLGNSTPPGRYTITVAVPGSNQGTDTGVWFFGPAWQATNAGLLQMDFYPESLGPRPEYGDIPAFLVSLSDDQQVFKLWGRGLTFLPFDFGWNPADTVLELDFVRQ